MHTLSIYAATIYTVQNGSDSTFILFSSIHEGKSLLIFVDEYYEVMPRLQLQTLKCSMQLMVEARYILEIRAHTYQNQ